MFSSKILISLLLRKVSLYIYIYRLYCKWFNSFWSSEMWKTLLRPIRFQREVAARPTQCAAVGPRHGKHVSERSCRHAVRVQPPTLRQILYGSIHEDPRRPRAPETGPCLFQHSPAHSPHASPRKTLTHCYKQLTTINITCSCNV